MDLRHKVKVRKKNERDDKPRQKPVRQILLDEKRRLVQRVKEIERELQTV